MTSPRRKRVKRGTIAFVVACLVLLLAVPIVWLLLPDQRPSTSDDALHVLTSHMDDVVATLPAELISSDEQSSHEGLCPADTGVSLVELRRVLVLDDAFDQLAWPTTLRESFPAADGWRVRTQNLATGTMQQITLAGLDLSLVNVVAEEEDEGVRLTMTSSSPCTAG
ncbi:hypothetical protein ACH3VR_12230 [Microbacterium sp. B2969]|uniref:Uncharacterized protein n=1 Tax=Microbacterium alkaliflavum TaxID=3248839 RepID=A0ABW7QAG6_9MICO